MGSYIILIMVAILLLGCCQAEAESVDINIGGWTFSADLEGWRFPEDFAVKSYDSFDYDPACYKNTLDDEWKGDEAYHALEYPAYPNAPKDNEYYGHCSGICSIYVVRIPKDIRTEFQEHDIALYGSIEDIPEDQIQQNTFEILAEATKIASICGDWDSVNEINYNDRDALLSESDGDGFSMGTIAFLLDDETVGVMGVNLPPRIRDESVFDGRAWDVIDSFTISKS
jgi:hypothetical protein